MKVPSVQIYFHSYKMVPVQMHYFPQTLKPGEFNCNFGSTKYNWCAPKLPMLICCPYADDENW